MKSSFIELIRSAFGPKDEKFRQRLIIFFICLVISVIIWFSIKLANNYDTLIEMPVTFTNLPKNKVLTGISDSILKVEIVDKGSDLFRLQYIQKDLVATISLKNISIYNKSGVYEGIVTPSAYINEIEHEHGLLGKILSIRPDTLYLSFENQKSKRMPVKAVFNLTFEKQFMRYGKIVLEPDCVTVKGPANLIEQMDSAYLGTINLKDLKTNTLLEQRFPSDSMNHLLEFSPVLVKVNIPVEKFTESEMDAPVKIVNNQSNRVKTFPDKVKVFYKVALKDFDKIEQGMITVAADFANVDIARDDRVKIKVYNCPENIVITRIEPEKAEFIIIK